MVPNKRAIKYVLALKKACNVRKMFCKGYFFGVFKIMEHPLFSEHFWGSNYSEILVRWETVDWSRLKLSEGNFTTQAFLYIFQSFQCSYSKTHEKGPTTARALETKLLFKCFRKSSDKKSILGSPCCKFLGLWITICTTNWLYSLN